MNKRFETSTTIVRCPNTAHVVRQSTARCEARKFSACFSSFSLLANGSGTTFAGEPLTCCYFVCEGHSHRSQSLRDVFSSTILALRAQLSSEFCRARHRVCRDVRDGHAKISGGHRGLRHGRGSLDAAWRRTCSHLRDRPLATRLNSLRAFWVW